MENNKNKKIAEIRERDVVSFNLQNLGITEVIFSEIGSFAPWDMKYKRDGEWFVSNIKVFKHKSDQPFSFKKWNKSWKTNPIEGHPVKKKVLEGLMRITMNDSFEDTDTYHEVNTTYTTYYRPTMLYMFSDGVALEWMIDELPIPWDPTHIDLDIKDFYNKGGFRAEYFIGAYNPNTQDDWTPKYHWFYGLDPMKATKWSWKEPVKPYRGRNEDCPSFTKKQEYLQSLADLKMK